MQAQCWRDGFGWDWDEGEASLEFLNDCKWPNFIITQVSPIDARARTHTHTYTHKMRSRARRRRRRILSWIQNSHIRWLIGKQKWRREVCLSRFCHLRLWTQNLQNQNLVNGVVSIGCDNRRLSWQNSGSISKNQKHHPKPSTPLNPHNSENCKPTSDTHSTPLHSTLPHSKLQIPNSSHLTHHKKITHTPLCPPYCLIKLNNLQYRRIAQESI